MLGAIIGDMVGSRFEFNNHLDTHFELFTDESTFTDDTICTIAIADALLFNRPFDISLVQWCSKYPNPKGSYGYMFNRWLKTPPELRMPYNSYGNGSAMRVSPVGWLCNDLHSVLTAAEESAKVTHNHPEGIKGAVSVADAIHMAKSGFSKVSMIDYITDKYGYQCTPVDEIRKRNNFSEICQVTVPQAFSCVKESISFENAIRLAVSIGGDSDTIAAITGSIAEAVYNIPRWMVLEAMNRLPDEMIDVVEMLYRNIK